MNGTNLQVKKMEADNTVLVRAIQNNQTLNGETGLSTIMEGDISIDNSDDVSVLTSAMKTYGGNTLASHMTSGTRTSKAASCVDTKAANTISNMSNDRQVAMESVIADRERYAPYI